MKMKNRNARYELTDKQKKEIGWELRVERVRKQLTLRDAGERIGVSENYLSEIERGIKVPSDEIIKNAAILYGMDEKYLFDRYNRIPIVVQDELRNNDALSRTIYELVTNEKLSDEERINLSKAIQALYNEYNSGK